ncbi:MAG: VCBS repeat-containing protein [Candidatus Sabulitectum sp.]|nr:VCBS repeat-containing protein [Candidatus Sabulitectum sp.]
MKYFSILIVLLLLSASLSQANSPSMIPWPVGSDTTAMKQAKTLMSSYGEFTNGWGDYHRGIDIDENTEAVNGDYVRCVEDGFVRRKIPTSDGWDIVIAPTMSSDNGWIYGHLESLDQANPDGKVWYLGEEISKGDLIQVMDPDLIGPNHLHFAWGEVWDIGIGLANPLDYFGSVPSGEVEEPEGSDYWQFNPEEYPTAYKFLILPENLSSNWDGWSISEVEALSKPSNFIDGNVDLFFGVTLQGVGMGSVPEDSTNCNPERVFWELVRDEVSGPNILSQNYVVNFDCTLSYDDEEAGMFYFRHRMWDMFGGNRAPLMCLTNCGDAQGWENLGIDNIEENSWRTNKNYAYLNETTINPVLAEYPDGSYSIDVTCYAHVNDLPPNPEVTFDVSIPCELHNFSPALRKVAILDAVTDQIFYHAEWIPNDLSADLDTTVNEQVDAGAELQVILSFSESMTTSSISAILGPLSVGNGEWSSSVVPNDTWIGEVTLPAVEVDGSYILSVSASDTDGLDLMDPEGAGTVPGPSHDTHHNLSLNFETELEWSAPVHDQVLGSPKLADIDLDGDLDVIIQSADGWVDVLDDDGSSMSGWPVSGNWSAGDPVVWASPAVVNLTGNESSNPEIIAVNPTGCNGFTYTGSDISPWSAIFPGEYAGFFALSSPVAGDFNGDGNNEFVMGRETLLDPFIPFPLTFFGRYNNGDSFWSTNWGNDESVSATATLCDADGIGDLEVLAVTNWHKYQTDSFCTLYCLNASDGEPQWSTDLDGTVIFGALVAGNLDTDAAMEIVVGATQGSNSIKVLDGSTGIIQYPKAISGGVHAGASIADINQDGFNDIVVSSQGGMLYCWDGPTGNSLSGFPVNLGTWTDDGISIGDIDLDGMLELIIAGKDGKLHVINHDGSHASGFPVTVSTVNALSGQPALGDIDGDGRLEILFGEQNNSVIHCYEMADNSAFTYLPWPQFQHDAMNTGYFPTDTIAPAYPTDFVGSGELAGSFFTVDLEWTLSVNDPSYTPSPIPPADVISYRIYRMIPPRPVELVGTVSAGVGNYTDVIQLISLFPVVAYRISAWDGVNESELTDWIKLQLLASDNIARGCPVSEIMHSAAVPNSRSHAVIASGTSSPPLIESGQRNNCRILTDGEYDAVYIPSGSSNCVEIDLGDVFQVDDLVVTGADLPLAASPRYELAVDGRSFCTVNSGRARYVRVYNVAGATEIEVFGSSPEGNSALIEIQRSTSGGYRIAAVESGSPISVSVFDLSGRNIWRSTSSTGEILWNRCSSSGNTVPTGVYLIMVESDDTATFTAKVIVR